MELDEISAFVAQQFPDGLSRHGWDYMTTSVDYVIHRPNQQHYILYVPQIELVFELVRRTDFPDRPSRLQSYFAFESLADAQSFERSTAGSRRSGNENFQSAIGPCAAS